MSAIFITGFFRENVASLDEVKDVLEKLGNYILLKPFNADELLQKIKKILEEPSPELFYADEENLELEDRLIRHLERKLSGENE